MNQLSHPQKNPEPEPRKTTGNLDRNTRLQEHLNPRTSAPAESITQVFMTNLLMNYCSQS